MRIYIKQDSHSPNHYIQPLFNGSLAGVVTRKAVARRDIKRAGWWPGEEEEGEREREHEVGQTLFSIRGSHHHVRVVTERGEGKFSFEMGA